MKNPNLKQFFIISKFKYSKPIIYIFKTDIVLFKAPFLIKSVKYITFESIFILLHFIEVSLPQTRMDGQRSAGVIGADRRITEPIVSSDQHAVEKLRFQRHPADHSDQGESHWICTGSWRAAEEGKQNFVVKKLKTFFLLLYL